MNPIEDQLRAAGRALTEQVTEVPELRLAPARRKAARRWPWAGHHRRWVTWAAPITAMVVIAAVAVTLVLVRNAVSDHLAPAENHGAPAVTAVPRYYVAANLAEAVIGDLSTGKTVATVKPADGHRIEGVIGSADDKTFVLDMPVQVNPSVPATYAAHQFYVYRAAEAGGAPLERSALTLTPSLSNEEVEGMALSPDGTRLAVLSLPPSNYEWVLRIYSMSTGMVQRQWTMPTGEYSGGGRNDSSFALTWTGNGQEVAFRHDISQSATIVGVSVFILNVARPGKNLRADSRIVTLPITASQCVNMLFTPDGKAVICGNVSQGNDGARCSKTVPPAIAEYSTATGKLTRVVYQNHGTCADGFVEVYWSSASGSAVIAVIALDRPTDNPMAPSRVIQQGLFSSGGRTELPLHNPADEFSLLNFDSMVAF